MHRQLAKMGFDEMSRNVKIKDFQKVLEVEVIVEGKGVMHLSTVSVCRPGLQLSGYFDYFGENRIQVLGSAEMFYYDQMDKEERKLRLQQIIDLKIPCAIITCDLHPHSDMVEVFERNQIPLFRSTKETSRFINDLTIYLNLCLAPETTEHGVLLDIYGTGVMLIGTSGIGKSETALELVHRGHRLVADDAILMRRVENKIIGSAPEKIRNFMEIRGVGIIDVRMICGVGSVLKTQDIDLVIQMEPWSSQREYDRLGQEKFTHEILGITLPKLIIPIAPGRNLPIIMEAAARNQRLKEYGYDPTKALIERSMGNMTDDLYKL